MGAGNNVEFEIRAKALLGDAQKQINQFLSEIEGNTKRTAQSTSLLGNALSTAAGTVAGFVSAQTIMRGVGAAFSFAKDAVFGMNATLETTTLQFTTLMGDADKARAHVRELFEIAKKTPFETGPIIEASRMMETFGGAALNTKQNIILLGDASAATGAPIDQLGFWVGRMYAMLQGGKPFGEAAMRLQELAVLSPRTRDEMEKLQKSGASASQVFKVFQDSLGKFNGAMEQQAGTWQGVVSTFKDTVSILLADTFKPFFEIVRDGLGLINEAMGSEGVQKAMESFKTSVAGAFGNDSQATVRSLAAGLLSFGQTAVTVVQGTYQTFQFLRTGVIGIAAIILETITKVAEGTVKVLEIAAKADPTGTLAKWAQAGRENVAFMRTLTNEFWNARKGAEAAAAGNDAFGKTMSGIHAVLGAASANLRTTKTATEEVATAARGAKPPVDGLGSSFTVADNAAKNFNKNITLLSRDVARGLKTLSDADFLREFGTKLDDARREMEKFGVTGTKVPEAIRQGLERLTKIRIAEWLSENNKEMAKEAARISEEISKQAEEAHKRSVAAMQSNLESWTSATRNAEEERARMTMSAIDFQLFQIQREADEKKAKLDKYGAFYKEAMAAIEQETAQKMAAARQAHNAEIGHMQSATGSYVGFFRDALSGLPGLIQKALTGGGGLAGGIQAMVSGLGADFGQKAITDLFNKFSPQILSGLGMNVSSMIGMFAGPVGAALGSLLGPAAAKIAGWVKDALGKVGGFFKDLFGGPDKAEREGREVAGAFRQGLLDALSPEQMKEVQEAAQGAWKGNEAGAATVIAIRDAYIAMGRSGEEALEIADRLWRAEKQGGDAVRRVIEEIRRVMDQAKAAQQSMTAASVAGFDRIQAEAQETWRVIEVGRDELGQPIIIPVRYDVENAPSPPSGGGGSSGGGSRSESDRIREAEEAHRRGDTSDENREIRQTESRNRVLAYIAAKRDKWQELEAFMRSNPGDWDRAAKIYGAAGGGVYTKPAMRVIAERSPEIVGDANTIVSALAQAMQRVGFGTKAGAGGGVTFNLTTPIATVDTIRQMVYDEIGPIFIDWIEGNKSGGRTRMQLALGIATR